MNGFLVLGLLHGFDVPLGLLDDRDAAEEFAESITPAEVLEAVAKAWRGLQPPNLKPIGTAIQEFDEGDPQLWEDVKHFEEQP